MNNEEIELFGITDEELEEVEVISNEDIVEEGGKGVSDKDEQDNSNKYIW